MSTPTAEVIAKRAQELKVVVLAQQLSVTAIMDPRLPLLRVIQHMTEVGSDEDVPLDLSDGPGTDTLRLSAREILTTASQLRGKALGEDLMAGAMLTAATQIGDMIATGQHGRIDVPILQFARHLRNAAAHGNRWHFTRNQPVHPATCRQVTLTADLHGQRAFWGGGLITPLLFVLYLDDVTNHFVPGLAPEPGRV